MAGRRRRGRWRVSCSIRSTVHGGRWICRPPGLALRLRPYLYLRRTRRLIPGVIRALDRVLASFRRQWHRRNKPFGFETIQVRLGGQRQRWLEMGTRLDELLAGAAQSMPELDERPPTPSAWTHLAWRYLAVSGIP